MAKNPILGLVGLVMMAAGLVMLFFIILSGVSDTTPLNKTYFLQADTDGISGAKATSQWTYFYVCGPDNTDCTKPKPAYAFGHAWDGNARNVPSGLGGSKGGHTTSTTLYYLWRFAWVFLILALFFNVLAFFSGFLACCGRLGSAIAYFVGLVGLLCHTVTVALITATFVLARNRFHKAGRDAKLGDYAFGFIWGSWAATVIAVAMFGSGMKKDSGSSGRSFFRRGGGNMESRRVKEDYS